MKVISLITQKGGVGKTTGTIHIGASLSELGYRVLLIDLDTQCNLSLGYNIEDFDYTIGDFLKGKISYQFHQRGRGENLYIIAGAEDLKEKNLKIDSLKDNLKLIEDYFDFVLIDCPPKPINEEMSLGKIAVVASDFVMSPVLADKFSLAGIGSFFNSVQKLKTQNITNANLLGVFFNIVEENTNHFQNYYSALKENIDDLLFDSYIRKDVDIKNAMDEGKTIFEIKPKGRVAQDYEKLTKEMILKINSK